MRQRIRMFTVPILAPAIDWVLILSILPILAAGLVTMYSFGEPSNCPSRGAEAVLVEPCAALTEHPKENTVFLRQVVWIALSLAVFFAASFVDWKFLRRSDLLGLIFFAGTILLFLLFLLGAVGKGAQSWFDLGAFSIQPVEIVKLILILVLAKYFSRRHTEIAHIRHILVSGLYAFILFVLVLLQPDFGGAVVIGVIWFGMVLLSGISKKHILAVFAVAILSGGFLWTSVFADYQKQRVITFFNPLSDIRGAGYNAYQSMIAIGSGGLYGKGVGYGTQSRLKFLPEYQTDFIFAAFAEEWGFVGVVVLLVCYGVLLWRILRTALYGLSNFEILYGLGFSVLIMGQLSIHIGMNLGLLPVTGLTMPFMSYGGSHLFMLFLGLGILMGMRRYGRAAHKELMQNEFLGVASG